MERITLNTDYSGLLNLEKSYKVYSLESIERKNWGYEGTLKITNEIKFQCVIKTGKDYVDILETSGKFSIHINFDNRNAEIHCNGISNFLTRTITSRISRLLSEYGKYFRSSRKRSVFLKDKGDTLVDLRGVYCPYGEVSIINILNGVKIGNSIEILSDCVAASKVFPKIAEELGFRYEIYDMGDYASYIFIRYRKTDINEPDLCKIKEGIRDYKYIASLFIYFNKIEKIEQYDEFCRDILDYDKEYLAVVSPRGRSWFLISYINKNILASRLEYEGVTFFDDCAFTVLDGLKGKFSVYRLIH